MEVLGALELEPRCNCPTLLVNNGYHFTDCTLYQEDSKPVHIKKVTKRKKNDAYYTPQPLADAIVDRIISGFPGGYIPNIVLEPSCGMGAFLRAFSTGREVIPGVLDAVDIDPKCDPQLNKNVNFTCCDFLKFKPSNPLFPGYDLIIGNPPYKFAEQHLNHAISLLKPEGKVAFLLRLSFLCSKGRAERIWGNTQNWELHPIAPRPCFTEDGKTDMSEYGLFVYSKTRRPENQLEGLLKPVIIWKK